MGAYVCDWCFVRDIKNKIINELSKSFSRVIAVHSGALTKSLSSVSYLILSLLKKIDCSGHTWALRMCTHDCKIAGLVNIKIANLEVGVRAEAQETPTLGRNM